MEEIFPYDVMMAMPLRSDPYWMDRADEACQMLCAEGLTMDLIMEGIWEFVPWRNPEE